jgi:hypothetical protein
MRAIDAFVADVSAELLEMDHELTDLKARAQAVASWY